MRALSESEVASLNGALLRQLLIVEEGGVKVDDRIGEDACMRILDGSEPVALSSPTDPFRAGALLELAIEKKYVRVISALLDRGVNVNNDCRRFRPLMYAIGPGMEDVLRVLLDRGADLDVEDENRATALTYARALGQESLARMLEEEPALRLRKAAAKIDHAAHTGADYDRETPPVPQMKKKPFRPGA